MQELMLEKDPQDYFYSNNLKLTKEDKLNCYYVYFGCDHDACDSPNY
jgi:hypothetical protein